MRITATLAALLACVGSASAYTPQCNITRGIYAHPGPLMSTSAWGGFGSGHEFTDEAAHSGRFSVRCSSVTDPVAGAGVSQNVAVNQTTPQPLKLSGWSKAAAVAGDERNWSYSLYLDLRYDDGTSWFMQIAPFSPGTHDWEYSETLLKPEKPVTVVALYAFVRQRAGTVYFDDLYLGPPEGPNLVRNPGFEPGERTDNTAREQLLSTFSDLKANALHTYLSGDPRFWQGKDGQGNPEVRELLKITAEAGLGVWLTTGGPAMPGIDNARDPDFPQYECVNGPWGEAWTRGLALAAGYDFAGISLVPDEYNWMYYSLRESLAQHADPEVKRFYEQLPVYCDCPVCRDLYQQEFGVPMPPLGMPDTFPEASDPYLRFLKLRYDSTTNWLTRSAEAVHRANPAIRADSLICVTPLCSDYWWSPGVAWDRLGETGMDFPTTDPYIQLHNYLGDSTHWYVTETAAHLAGATPKRQCGIVLEASRLDPAYREADPVEIYGSALSAVAHGAKELAWWHYTHLVNEAPTTDRPELSRACVRGVYGLLEQADPWLADLQPLKRVAFLHSRASDDFWRFYAGEDAPAWLSHPSKDPRYAAIAQKEVLYYLFRRGVPTDLYYLDSVLEAQLQDYPVIMVPFPLAVGDGQAALLARLAEAGKTVVVVAECGLLDGDGFRRQRPALLDLLGLEAAPQGEVRSALQNADPSVPATGDEPFTVYAEARPTGAVTVLATAEGRPAIWERAVGRGKVVYLAGAFGHDLPLNRDNQKRTRSERISPDPLAAGHVAVLDALLKRGCGDAPWLLGSLSPGQDVEATCLTNRDGDRVVLAINWGGAPVETALRLPTSSAREMTGWRITSEGALHEGGVPLTAEAGASTTTLTLAGGEAGLWRYPGGTQ